MDVWCEVSIFNCFILLLIACMVKLDKVCHHYYFHITKEIRPNYFVMFCNSLGLLLSCILNHTGSTYMPQDYSADMVDFFLMASWPSWHQHPHLHELGKKMCHEIPEFCKLSWLFHTHLQKVCINHTHSTTPPQEKPTEKVTQWVGKRLHKFCPTLYSYNVSSVL